MILWEYIPALITEKDSNNFPFSAHLQNEEGE